MKLKSATQGAIAIQILTLLPGKGQATCRSSSPSTPLVSPSALLQPPHPLCPVSTDHTDIPLQHSSPTQHYFIPAVSGKPSAMPARGASRPAEQSAQLPRSQLAAEKSAEFQILTLPLHLKIQSSRPIRGSVADYLSFFLTFCLNSQRTKQTLVEHSTFLPSVLPLNIHPHS